jgi:hypothetical protein
MSKVLDFWEVSLKQLIVYRKYTIKNKISEAFSYVSVRTATATDWLA